MQWLNSLDEAFDRVLVNNEGDENDSLENSDGMSVHSDPGSLHPLRPDMPNFSDSLIQQAEEEEGDHFIAERPSEQTPGQDSTSALLPLIIEPDSSMLVNEDDNNDKCDNQLPTFEPSGSSEALQPVTRDSIYYESEQSVRTLVVEDEETKHQFVRERNDSEHACAETDVDMEATLHMDNTETIFVGMDDAWQQNGEADVSVAPESLRDSKQVFRQAPDHPVVNTDTRRDRNVSFENEHVNDEVDVPTRVVGKNDDDDHFSEFNVSLSLSPWNSSMRLDPWLNCYGVVHARLVCAQRLPCPVGSSVQGILALPPWKGRVRTEKTRAFLGPEHTGVCVRWDQLEDGGYCSMVNSWNSLDNPTPTISIDLVFHPLQMLEYTMCSVSLSCAPLMNKPGEWKKHWCKTTISQTGNDSEGFLKAEERVPFVLVEAMFVPATKEDDLTDEPNDAELQYDDGQASVDPSPSIVTSLSPSVRTPKTKSHLLRVQSLWVPAACAVCGTVVVGLKCAFRCEACSIDCCKDCQLHVDLQVPCGSSIAKHVVAASFHNKLTLENVMNAVAPWDRTSQMTSSLPEISKISKALSSGSGDIDGSEANRAPENEPGVGTLRVHVARAFIFEKALHPKSKPDDVFKESDDVACRRGDYYVRLTSSGNQPTRRTRTIQNTGKPQFDSEEFVFNVLHYGTEYRIDVVDSYTDKSIGMVVMTAQSLLQQQRDNMIAADGFAIVNPFQRPASCTEKRRWRHELRNGMKSGDYFAAAGTSKKGEIVGWLDVDLCLTENIDQLYSSHPVKCPARPPDTLNVELLQAHIARIGALLGDVKNAVEAFSYMISWKNPALTSLSLILFVTLCLRFNAEYIASLPVFFLVAYMTFLATLRKGGHLKDRFVEREKIACLESEKKVSVKYSIYRPIGRLNVAVHRGRNIRSRDLGLAGRAGCFISWVPFRFCENEKKMASLIAVDASLSASHDIGKSNFHYSTNPIWDKVYESEETKRLRQLIPSRGEFFGEAIDTVRSMLETNEEDPASCVFPVLQPIKVTKRRKGSNHGNGDGDQIVELDSWESTQAAVVVEVRFQDVLNKLPGFDDVLGEVSFPLSQIIKDGDIRGWFPVVDPGAELEFFSPVGDNCPDRSTSADTATETAQLEPTYPEVYLELKWIPPEPRDDNIDSEREASVVVAEEMIRSASQAKSTRIDLMGTSIGAFNTVTGLSGNVHMIQNVLGSGLDTVESIRNAFNFTDPHKSSVLLCALVLLWTFLAMIPLRMLILVGGLAVYAVTFQAAYLAKSKGENEETLSKEFLELEVERPKSPISIWIMNAIRGLPTNEDLRKAYFWESRRVGEEARATLANQKRTARLQKLWRAQWYASIQLKTHQDRLSSVEERDWHWTDAFAIIQGRRFLWWPSANDFDNGEAPTGRIFLTGHAGLAGLSPLEVRQLDDRERPLVTSIFGRGLQQQQKLTILTENVQSKEALEMAVLEASQKEE